MLGFGDIVANTESTLLLNLTAPAYASSILTWLEPAGDAIVASLPIPRNTFGVWLAFSLPPGVMNWLI